MAAEAKDVAISGLIQVDHIHEEIQIVWSEFIEPSWLLESNTQRFERLFAMTTQGGCKKSEGYLE